ncbi:MAG: phage terminase large subunit, partial [Silvibacterium sp.]
EEEEVHEIKLLNGKVKTVFRHVGEALHPEREPLSILAELREALGEYNFAGQYQQCPAPLSGGLVQKDWFKTYDPDAPMPEFEFVFQSWDTANKPGDDCDFSVCTTWGCREKRYYLLHVLRKRLGFPDLKRLIVSHAALYGAKNVLIEDKASGTSLIQALIDERFHQVTRYTPKMDKAVRLQVVTPFIENGFVYLPGKAPWLGEYIHEMVIFNKGKYDDQVDSTSQALDWVSGKNRLQYGLLEWAKRQETDTGVDPAYAAMFTRPRGPAR